LIGRICVGLALFLATHSQAFADVGRPNHDAGPTKVEVFAAILDINEISDAKQNFEANFLYILTWFDPRLAHDQDRKSTPLNDVWHPRLQILNQQRLTSTFPKVVSISPEGQVTYRQRVWGIFSQPLYVRDFPFDHQDFGIRLFTADYAEDEVELVVDPRSQIAESLSLPDWDIVAWNLDATTYKPLPDVPVELAMVVFSFQAERRGTYFVYQIILPLVLIVAMSWIVFWIDPKESGSQYSVSITTMLTLIAYRFAIAKDMPIVDYMTRLDIFILGSTVMVFATLMQAVITTSMAKSGQLVKARAIDRWCRWLVPGLFALLGLESLWLRLII
jgi:hypothetical protein